MWLIMPATAQTRQHVIERGETITSIATLYGVSEQDIITANPDVANYIYTGMVLDIPMSDNTKSITPTTNPEQPAVEVQTPSGQNIPGTTYVSTESDSIETSEEKTANINVIYLLYNGGYKKFDKGFYGIGWKIFNNNGFGLNFALRANYGIVNDLKGISYSIGPAFGHMVKDWLIVDFTLTGVMSMLGVKDGDLVITGGIHATPGIRLKLGPVQFGVGFIFGWEHSPSYEFKRAGVRMKAKSSDKFVKSVELSFGI